MNDHRSVRLAEAAAEVSAAIDALNALTPPHELDCVCELCLAWLVARGDLCETVNGLGFQWPGQVLRERQLARALLGQRFGGG